MISDLVKAYLDKFADYKDSVLSSISKNIPTTITTSLPRVRNILKSTMLNRLFDIIFSNILVIYSVLDSKLREMSAKHTVIKASINEMNSKLDYLETYITSNISQYRVSLPVTFNVFKDVIKTEQITLAPVIQTYVTPEDISRNDDGTCAITTTISPWCETQYSLPYKEDESKVLFSTGIGSLHYERSLFSDAPLSFIYNGIFYNGILVKIEIPFISAVPMNQLRIDMLPNHYSFLYIRAYYINSDGDTTFTNIVTDQDTEKYIDTETELINMTKLELAINVPFPTMDTGKTSINLTEIKEFIDKLGYSMRSFKDFKQYLSTSVGNFYSAYKYKYMCGIYSIKIFHNTYKEIGIAKSVIMNTPSKENTKTFIRLTTTHDVDTDESIAYLLHTDIYDKLIVPYTINNEIISDYTIRNTSLIDGLDVANATIEEVTDSGILSFTDIQADVSLEKFVVTETINVDATKSYAVLPATPTEIVSIYYQSYKLSRAYTLDDLSSSVVTYYILGNLIFFNRIYPTGSFTITYRRGPQWFRILAVMSTNDTSHAPILTSTNVELITTPKLGNYSTDDQFIDRSKAVR